MTFRTARNMKKPHLKKRKERKKMLRELTQDQRRKYKAVRTTCNSAGVVREKGN